MCSSEIEDRFVAHVEEEVEDAEVGQETVFLLIDLIIGQRLEVGIGKGIFRTDGVTQVDSGGGLVGGGELDVGVDVEEFAHLLYDVEVELEEGVPMVVEEGAQVVGVIVEEGALAVG